MFFIILIIISVISFLIGLYLGKNTEPRFRAKPRPNLEENEFKNFLSYDGDIQ